MSITEEYLPKRFLWKRDEVHEIRSPQCETCIYKTGLFKCSEFSPIPRKVMTVEEPCPKYRKTNNT